MLDLIKSGEPFLFAVDGNAVLRWKVVERGERSDQIRTGVEPHGHFSTVHQVVQQVGGVAHAPDASPRRSAAPSRAANPNVLPEGQPEPETYLTFIF